MVSLQGLNDNGLTKRLHTFLPVLIAIYLIVGLGVFIIFQGDMNDWSSFMRSDAALTLFALYCILGVLGFGLTFFLRKNPDILRAPKKTTKTCFLLVTIIGIALFTVLNFSATEEHYAWMNDGLIYQQMAQSFLVNREFIIDGNYIHHFAPVYPLYLSIFYAVLPVHLGTQVALEIIFLLAVSAVFLVTKKMYGLTPALITTGLIATVPIYVFSASRNYSEPLVLALYTLTVFFILESLKPGKENRIIIAGLTAALGFLTKSSIGYFFILTGAVGFLWRFHYMKWSVFRNKHYFLAIAIFLTFSGLWTARNLNLFWDGTFLNFFEAAQPSEYMQKAMAHAFTVDIADFFVESLLFIGMIGIFMSSYLWFFTDYIKKAFKRMGEERLSCLLLSIALPIFLGCIISAMYFVFENYWMPDYWISYHPISQVRYLVYNLVRYCFIAIVPLSWLAYEGKS